MPTEQKPTARLFRRLCQPGIFNYLHWAGFKGNYSPLSVLTIYRRNIVRVHDHGLHLLWKSSIQTHFIKPLPSIFAEPSLDLTALRPRTRGLFYSYTQLIRSELDFTIAKEMNLLPSGSQSTVSEGQGDWEALTTDDLY